MTPFPILLKTSRLLLAGMAMAAAANALALTLGPNVRSAVLGQPLDLSVQAMPEAGDAPSALCLDADVFYADRQLDKGQVQLSSEKSPVGQDFLIRIRSAVPVEGPVVTVHLRGGCVQKTSRRYVVLAAAKPRSLAGSENGQAAGVRASPSGDGAGPDAEKLRALETELRQLREDALKNRAVLAETELRIERAESARYSRALVFALAALLCAAVIGLFYLSYRRSIARLPVSGGGALHTGQAPLSSLPASASVSGRDGDTRQSLFGGLTRAPREKSADSIPPLSARDRPRFSVSVPFVPRTVKVPELFDLQQQVDFFTSLGRQDKAIALLRKHLVDNVKTSALVYLDLLDLYHQTGNQADYEDLRDDFNRVFGTKVAPFQSYRPAAAGSPAHAAVLLRVQAAWPRRQVFHAIEDALFREPGNPDEVLAPEDYRELLLLFAVAREIIDLAAGPASDTQWPDLAMQPRSSPRLGLDIDLSQLPGGEDRTVHSPAVDTRAIDSAREREQRRARERAGAESGLAELLHTARRKESERSGVSSRSAPMTRNPLHHTGLDSLVDFDDYDTGYRPEDFDRPKRS